jgi:asparagine synthase (glutamine-hydrolysing)
VAEQLEADVPVGAFLSGGLDSSTIATLANRHRPGLDVFAFDMPESSEVAHARSVAERHGMTLHVCRPDLGAEELPDLLGRMADVWDEPFADSSALPTWLLSRFARERVTVALTGDGADELLGGYLCWARGYLEEDDPARGGPPATNRGRLGRLRRRRARHSAVAARYARFREYLDDDDLERLGLPPVGIGPVDLDRYREGTADDISRFDIDHYLPGDILVKTDRASMAHGLEVRSPFLDVGVAEGCLRLPAPLKVDAHGEKLLLRRAFATDLPPAVTSRPKQGFGAPMDLWLGIPSVRALRRDLLEAPDSPLFDLVDRRAVAALAVDDGQRTWNLLTVALWWDRHRSGASA